jgi:protein-disulfide isomerase
MQTDRANRRDFFFGFLVVFSACSLLLNAVFLFTILHPSFFHDLELSRLHPPPVRTSDQVRGNPNAPVTVIEYSDFQCPFCRKIHASLKTAVDKRQIRWVYRDFPLRAIHPLAFREAAAARCAGAQGKFWEYADALFRAQERIRSSRSPDRELTSLARDIHADPVALKACLDSGRFTGTIKHEISEAKALQIRGTPTLFIDNKRHEGMMSYEDLKSWLAQHPT